MSFNNLNKLLKQKIKNEFCTSEFKAIQDNILVINLTKIESYLKNYFSIMYEVTIIGWSNYKQKYILICDKTKKSYLYKNWEFKTSNEYLKFIKLKYALIGLENQLKKQKLKIIKCIFKVYENNKYIYVYYKNNFKTYIYTHDLFNLGLFLEL